MIYVSSSTMAELVASFVLCPWEAIRIRMVSQPKLFQQLNTFSGVRLVYRNEGLLGLYKGLGPVCFKQVPYTVTQLTVFSHLVDGFYNSVLPLLSETRRYKNDLSPTEQLAVSTGCGFIAGVASAVTSHPADTVLSIINAK
jgi:solute carrier family 25 phosphate transporter 3